MSGPVGASRGISFGLSFLGVAVKSYDLVYIVRPHLDADALKAVTERMSQRIIDQGGTIEAVEVWGKKRMTFTVKKYREGIFVHTRFALPPNKVEEIRRAAALTEDVLRATITNAVGKLPEAKPAEPSSATAVTAPAPAATPAAPLAPVVPSTPEPQSGPAEV